MLRNCYNWDCDIETNFWEVICDKFYRIDELPSKTRNQIRRCLRDCNIKKLTAIELINSNGYKVYKEAFNRYHDIAVTIPPKTEWERGILNDSTHEFWGVFEKETEELIAWAMNTVSNEYVNYNVLKAIPEKMNRHYPYFGLLYTMNQHYLEEKSCKYVTDGWRSVTEHSGIQPFLEKNFKFRKAYCNFKLYYASWFGYVVKILYPLRSLRILPLNVRNILKFEEINRCGYNSACSVPDHV